MTINISLGFPVIDICAILISFLSWKFNRLRMIQFDGNPHLHHTLVPATLKPMIRNRISLEYTILKLLLRFCKHKAFLIPKFETKEVKIFGTTLILYHFQ